MRLTIFVLAAVIIYFVLGGFFAMLFILLVGGGWSLGSWMGGFVAADKEEKNVFIDKSVHHHYHDNRSVNLIDEEGRKKLMDVHNANKRA